MDDPNVYQQLGSLQAKVSMLERGQREANSKLDQLLARSAVERGARRMLAKIGAASGLVGGLIVALLQYLVSLRNPP